MSHFGRSGPPDIAETYSLLILNISFRTTADDLFPYFDKYGEVMDVFIPKDKRTGESRGFAFVRYKYQDEAQKAVDRLDGKVIHGREIAVQFAKYGPNAERIHKGKISEPVSRTRSRERSRSPRRYRDDYYRSPGRSRDRYDRYEYERYPRRDRGYDRSRSRSPDYDRGRYARYRRSPSYDSASPRRYSPSPRRSLSPRGRSPPRGGRRRDDRSPTPRSASPRRGASYSRSPSPRNGDAADV